MKSDADAVAQTEQDAPLDPSQPTAHVSNLGRLVEDMELKMRSLLEAVYGSKTKGASRSAVAAPSPW